MAPGTDAPRPADRAGVVLLTPGEVAAQMRVSTRQVYRLIHAGELPALRIGHSFRILVTATPARRSDTNLAGPAGR
jgi:excisionase family DNA binding protein